MRVAEAGHRHVHAFRHERARHRETDTARSAGHNRHLPAQVLFHSCHYNSPRMHEVAIVGAGELGGALAHVLARRDIASRIRLIDASGQIAAGKALDIMQASPIQRFSTTVSGSTDITKAASADIVVLADGAGGPEWQDGQGLLLLTQLAAVAAKALVLCAGATQRELVDRAVRELRFARSRIVGSAPEALAGAVRALVALEVDGAPRDVALTVLGVPPAHAVVPWEDA